jgi:hypothetical protein
MRRAVNTLLDLVVVRTIGLLGNLVVLPFALAGRRHR